MQTIGSLFQVLNQGLPIDLIVLALLIYMLFKMNGMSKDISQISKDLGNHITDTNRRIENLTHRFDRLYEILIKDKQ